MKSKKGALELSMNTIVVIVIGVVILSLGLIFVRSVFTKLGTQTDIVFGESENALNELAAHDDKLTVQSKVTVKQGKQTEFKIWVVNIDEEQATGLFTITAEPSTGGAPTFTEAQVNLEFANPSQELDVGEEVGFVAGVRAASNAPLRSGGYQVTVYKDNVEYASSGFFVEVTK